MRFSETRLERGPGSLTLLHESGQVLLALEGIDLEKAIFRGRVDPEDAHYSMFDYARMQAECGPVIDAAIKCRSADEQEGDRAFLDEIDVRWD